MSANPIAALRTAAGASPRLHVPALFSFDIDGTLEVGDPPGPIPAAFIRSVREAGWMIGSSSDRTIGEQDLVWERIGIAPDFTCRKHEMELLTARFRCSRYLHVGDTDHDKACAEGAGFEFIFTDAFRPEDVIAGFVAEI